MPGINLGKIQGSNSILKPPTHKYHFYGLGANLSPAGSFRYQKRPVLIGLKEHTSLPQSVSCLLAAKQSRTLAIRHDICQKVYATAIHVKYVRKSTFTSTQHYTTLHLHPQVQVLALEKLITALSRSSRKHT